MTQPPGEMSPGRNRHIASPERKGTNRDAHTMPTHGASAMVDFATYMVPSLAFPPSYKKKAGPLSKTSLV